MIPLNSKVPKQLIRHLLFVLLLIYTIPSHAMVFNNISLTDTELIDQIERSYATGANKGFGGFKQYTLFDLNIAYNEFKDPYILEYLITDFMALSDKEKEKKYIIEPISDMRFKTYYYGGDVENKERYCIENQEGRCLEEGMNGLFNMAGQARFFKNITLFYEGEIQVGEETKDIQLKKIYSKYRLGPIEFEV